MAKHKARFVNGAKQNGVDSKTAEKLFILIEKFGGYGFNKSHSAAYAMIAYQTAYLKAHYPVQFMAALLTQDMGNQDKTIKNIAECKGMDIDILPPDVNESQADFSVVGGKIRFGLAAVKNVGLKAVESVIQERSKKGPFPDLADFCKRVENSKVNRRVLEGLILCGAFDFTGTYRSRLFAALDDVLRFCGINRDPNQLNIFGSLSFNNGENGGLLELPEIDEWDEKDRLRKEKEALGFYITGHPLDRYGKEIKQFATCSVDELFEQKDKSTVKIAGVVENLKIKRTKRGDKMAILNMEDLTGSTEVVVFPDIFSQASPLLKCDDPLFIKGSAEIGDNSAKIIAQEIATLDSIREKAVKAIVIRLREEDISNQMLEDLRYATYKYPGDCGLIFKVKLSRKKEVTISAHTRFNVIPRRELIAEIEDLIGNRVHELI
jgi:DNA polymerase-3 subunit alpha